MKKYVVTLLKVLIFFLILFEAMRVVFAFYYWNLIDVDQIPYTEVFRSFFKSFSIDIATACYMMVIPAIAMFVGICINKETNFKWMRWYFYILIGLYVLIVVGEMGIYGEWRTKLNYKALLYLKHPDEIINTATTTQAVKLISLWAAFTVLFCWWYVKWIEPTDKLTDKRKLSVLLYPVVFVLTIGAVFLGMRGGFNAIPISTSSGYFSNYKLANVIAVNPAYNLMENMTNVHQMNEKSSFSYMDVDKAMSITEALHKTDCDSTVYHVSKIDKPNIMVVLLESWSADLIETLGGDPSVTPNFHVMEKDGLLFSNIYASANRSEQAQANIFGGFPGLPMTTITNHPEKYYAIPSLLTPLDSLGYYTSYYYGGELNYANILSYLRFNNFDKIVDHKDINERFHSGKLGYHDTDVLPWVAKQLTQQPEPFFSTVFTQSSHSPYDYPKILERLEWTRLEPDYMNSAKYVDYALKLFIETARTQPWYDNTIFIFVADHSHETEKNFPLESFDYHRIPLLIYGEPLQDSLRGKIFDKICSSLDIPATLLAQFGLNHDKFFWSKNVFNYCYRPFAYFEMGEGFGWKTNEGTYLYSNHRGPYDVNLPEDIRDSIIEQGKAYVQSHFEMFCNY